MGRGKGGGGPGRFAEQCDGLQGVWAESDMRMKRWVVSGPKAFRMTKAGVSNSSYTLCEGEDGGLVWGNNGVYVLDPAFKPGMSAVTWLRASRKGEVAFTWTYVGPAPGEEEEAEAPGGATAKGKSKGKAKGEAKGEAKGKAKGEAKGWAKGEAKGWAKGEAKGWAKGEAKGWGKAKAQAQAYDSWWQGGKAGKGQWSAGKVQEKRIDPGDKNAYTWEEFKAHYLAHGQSVTSFKAWWANMAVAPDQAAPGWPNLGRGAAAEAEPERRVDADGKAYTWEELRSYYASEFTKKASEHYWEALAPAPATGKGKTKGKAERQGKGKAKGYK